MTLKTGEEYVDSLKTFKPNVYIAGQKVEQVWDSPYFRTSINQVAASYDLALDPEYADRAAVMSPLTGEKVPRLSLHIQETMEDALIKAELTRDVTKRRLCAFCLSNFLTVPWAFTYDIDQKYGTSYHQRYKNFIIHMQKNDYRASWAMMDPKGDRSVGPSKQNPLVDVRIIEKNDDGIIVSGAKAHGTLSAVDHEIVVMPCRALTEADKDFAVAFAVPIDAEGVTMICRPAPGPVREVKLANPLSSKFVGVEALTVFDNVFVPWERVFMCGEWDMCGRLPAYFSMIHRQSKCACSAGHVDMMIGTCSLLAKVNGLNPMKVKHINDKLADMVLNTETAYGCSLGAATNGTKHPSGVWMPSALIANAGLSHVRGTFGNHLSNIHDIAGGLLATMPLEADFLNPDTQEMLNTYLKGGKDYTTEERYRALELARDLAASHLCGNLFGFTINAAGSPVTNKIEAMRLYSISEAEDIAAEIAGVEKKK